MLTGDQVAAHASKDDLWMIISGKAYDLTEVSAALSWAAVCWSGLRVRP